jgi:hypothetical protein
MGPELVAGFVILGCISFVMVVMIGVYYFRCIQSPLETLLAEYSDIA